jgi:PAS domain-containing protein
MPFQLVLTLDYAADTQWRWVLSDAAGRFLADHEVSLDPSEPAYESFSDLPQQLRRYENVRPAEEVLSELGAWMGERVFGAVGERLLDYEQSPACVVQVRVPPAAQNLLFRPFELAHLGGRPLAGRDFRLIYTVARDAAHRPGGSAPKDAGATETLRVLGVFSLPRDATPLNLRRERYRLQQLVRRFVQTRGLAVELRLLQYGATRRLLADIVQEAPGWDVMHFSGHGAEGELILERPDGTADEIDAEELAKLLRPAGARLKLLTLSACYSGAADVRAARAQVGLDDPQERSTAPAQATNVLPSLGQRLAEELDCAVLAMRYPVEDTFATELALTLYDRLLDKRQPLPQALQLALSDALSPAREPFRPEFSRLTPLLFGARAADLTLQAPRLTSSAFAPPQTGLFGFPPMPVRFVGRLMPMLDASQALAPESGKTGVLFYGMAGAGKTACALELAYHYDPKNLERFTAFVWHKAPDEGHDIADALTRLALSMEDQLPGLELVGLIDDPQDFKRKALPRLRALLQDHAILLVLDNLEGLLTSQGDWRDPRWGELLGVLLDHDGLSRLVLTSRRVPSALAVHPRLQADPIHALSFPESVLLARQLPNLKQLFKDGAGRERLRRILRAAQGHPKLLELADGLAADTAALEAQLARDETATAHADAARIAFFESGRSDRPEDIFVRELRAWTEGVARNLPPTARLLSQFLARLEDSDRTLDVVEANWEDFLKRLTGEREEGQQPAPEPALSQAQAALTEPGLGLEISLNQLAQAGLIEIETTISQEQQTELTPESLQTLLPILAAQNPEVAALMNNPQGFDPQDLLPHIQAALADPTDPALQAWLNSQQTSVTRQRFRLHPGVAEALLRSAPPAVPDAADKELGDYFVAMYRHGIKTEMQGGGRLVVEGARHAVPYLLRAQRLEEAALLLERMIQRDTTTDTLALAIPLLRHIMEKTQDTAKGLENLGVLASALSKAGHYAEAEQMERDRIARCVAQGNYRLAATGSIKLFYLLLRDGRFEEALRVAEEQAAYARRAGRGLWTQLVSECLRLQALGALGHYAEVLDAVEQYRVQMKGMPEQGSTEEIVSPWNVREGLLDTGHTAAVGLKQWETALALNAERVKYQRQRGANEFELARSRFNDYGPLLRLGRDKDARDLLEYCRAVFERESALYELSAVYGALADLEYEEGHPVSAARFEQTALRYKYQMGGPEDCAISHNNLANYIERAEGGEPDAVLAHRLAAGVIYLQISSGILRTTIHNLAGSPLPPAPPSFEQVCAVVEQVEGVRFREMFARLPKRAPDGDAAIQAVWEMAKAEAERLNDERAQIEALLANLPEAVREALLSGDEEQFNAAFAQLTPEQQQAVMAALQATAAQAGSEPEQEGEDRAREVLREFEPLLQAIAAVARGDAEGREEIEEVLPQLEEDGWHITEAVGRIWAGERDAEALTGGLDEQDAALVRRVLGLLEST